MQRYEQLLKAAQRKAEGYDMEAAESLLKAAESRRAICEAEYSLGWRHLDVNLIQLELELRESIDEVKRDYPVPAGLKRKAGCLGCGDPVCDICYEPARG